MGNIFERNGIVTMTSDDIKREKADYTKAVFELMKTIHHKPKLVQEIAIYRKYVPIVLEYCEGVDKLSGVYQKTFERMETDSEEKRYQRWTDEEDALLIEMVCQNRSMLEVSTAMGRTVPSIKTRVSKLVGIKRISQEIAGRFIGTLDGKQVDGYLNGTIRKEG